MEAKSTGGGRVVMGLVIGFVLGCGVMYGLGTNPTAGASGKPAARGEPGELRESAGAGVKPAIVAESAEALGERLIALGACHDCHTPMDEKGQRAGKEAWLTGTPVGWRGPWGTTYAANLRMLAAGLPSGEAFVSHVRFKPAAMRRPPMTWDALDAMTDAELSAIWSYLRTLGTAGGSVPAYLPPGEKPSGPWMSLDPSMNR